METGKGPACQPVGILAGYDRRVEPGDDVFSYLAYRRMTGQPEHGSGSGCGCGVLLVLLAALVVVVFMFFA